jgi:hypothetical protein
MKRDKKRWQDLSPNQRAAIVGGAAVEAVVTTVAIVDIVRRPRSTVRGPKVLWIFSFVVQPFGPIAYFAFGRAGLPPSE